MGQVRTKTVIELEQHRRERARRAREMKAMSLLAPRKVGYAKADGWPTALVGAIVLQLVIAGIALFSLATADEAASTLRLSFVIVAGVATAGLLLRSRRAFELSVALAGAELLAVFAAGVHALGKDSGAGLSAWSLATIDILPALPGGMDVVLSTIAPALTLFLLTRQHVRDCYGLPVWA